MSTSETLSSHNCHCGEHLTMVKTAKMELLRALVSECLSAAAEEILKIVERTIIEYEEEMSCSKWVVDSHRRLLDAARTHSEDSLQMSVTDVKMPPASVNVSVCWEEPGNSTTQPTEDHSNTNDTNPDSPVSQHADSDQEILIDIDDDDDDDGEDGDDDDIKPECELNMPLKILKVKKPFKCPICLSVFSSKKTMVRHIKRHPEDKSLSYQCQFCERYFYHKSDFIIHTRIHKGSKPYKCQDCDKSFDQRDSLVIHRQKHTEQKTHQCLTKTLALNLHTETHHRSVTPGRKMEEELDSRQEEADGIKTFPLTITPYDKSEFDQESLQPLCLYQIQTVADIDKHSATVPVDHIKTEPTAADGGTSDTTADHQLLLSVNPGEQGEAESITNILPERASKKSTELVVQFEAGTAQKPYKCPCCSKCFSLTKTLIRHVKIHTEDKAYQCQFCGRNFCQKSDLVNHTRIHTGERPYQCQQCHKSFVQKGNLVVHMRKHTGEKPYQCQECSCCFSQKSSLDCHMQSHRL
ncbi:zinc finger protein 2-like [Thunnus albacares]|uniref:zinc finger protein 2-like n=1 Tax=Thunnus albacares TaxID=8236 RepID=UPI001CF6C42F|nr:zinc finger protein 2-like [Thunnus albacares]XP_044192843.1 zinc finger protein 2-like [Thunnus albacares]XP_044192844.1 zinc finger protein 2-like [Thunnus albacares]